jgi:hypothetical protein
LTNERPNPTVSARPSGDSTIEKFLTNELTTGEDIKRDGSPQRNALLALQKTNPDLDPSIPEDRNVIRIRYALNVLYYFTAGDLWLAKDGWTTGADPCSWFGDLVMGHN